MGFMAGFGPAFARGLEKNQELREQRKDDAFKLTFSEFSKRNEQYTEDKKKDQQAVRKAKALASEKNPDAWPLVAEWVRAGLDDETIQQRLQGEFKVSKGVSSPATPGSAAANPAAVDSRQAPSTDPVAQQTEASGLATPTRPQAAPGDTMVSPDAPEDDTGPKGFLSDLSGKFKGAAAKGGGSFMRDTFGNGGGAASRQAAFDDAKTQISQATGQDVGKIMTEGYTPPANDTSGIQWTPPKATPKPDPINTLNDAALERMAAQKSGDPDRMKTADTRYRILQDEALKASRLKAMENGIAPTGTEVRLRGPDGKDLGGAMITTGADGSPIDANTGQPLPPGVMPRAIGKEEQQLTEQIAGELDQPLQKLGNKRSGIKSAVRLYGEIGDIVDRNGDMVLQPLTTGVAQWLQRAGTETKAAVDLINQAKQGLADPKTNPGQTIQNLEVAAQALEGELNNPAVDRIATERTLLETKQLIMAYQIGAMMGQDGRSLQENERVQFMKVAAGGTTRQKFHQGMSEFLSGRIADYDQEEGDLFANSRRLNYMKEKYGYVPGSYEALPVSKELEGNLKAVTDVNNPSGDPGLAKGYQMLNTHSMTPKANPVDAAQRNMGLNEPAKKAPPPNGTTISKKDAQGNVISRQQWNGKQWVPVPLQ